MSFAARPALAVVLVGAALIGAFLLHRHRETHRICQYAVRGCFEKRHPGWADPAALGVLVLGAAAATGVAAASRRGKNEP